MDQKNDWALQCAATIGESVARRRAELKLSAQRLAALCAELGMPSLTRTVITKLENGRKEAVSTAELLVLAKALDVPPAVLMFPLGVLDTVEVTPGDRADPLSATFWLSGQDQDFPGTAAAKGTPLDLFMLHRSTVTALRHSLPFRHVPPRPGDEQAEQEIAYHASVLRTARDAIRKLGLKPPALIPVIANVVEREADPDAPR